MRFGVYRSVCCGAEIVIGEGVTFPDCPKHPHLTTQWRYVQDDKIRHVSDIVPPKENGEPAA
jgi:hypothetical protein